MKKISLIKRFIFALSIVFFASCDTDYNGLGSDIVGGDVHNDIVQLQRDLVAYDRPTGAVQSNNLPVNTLGVYDNPVFGKTTASYVTQVSLAAANPTFYDGIAIDSVYLYVPYYSTLTATDATSGKNTYTLDSIYGDTINKFRLSIKRNGYFLRDADASTSGVEGQKYYSSDKSLIDGQAGVSLLAATGTNTNPEQSIDFAFSAAEIKRKATPKDGTEKVVETLAPGMFINLNKQFFNDVILKAPAGKLLNSTVFNEYFRGIYFQAEQIAGSGNIMGVPNFAKGVITIKYHDNVPVTVNGVVTPTPTAKSMALNLTGNSINFFQNDYKTAFTSAIATSNAIIGDSRLYLKGGDGSMAFVTIPSSTLTDLMHNDATGYKVLVNEANIVFNVDTDAMAQISGNAQPLRIYLYDLKNRKPLYDYTTDATTNSVYPKKNKYIHGGIAEYNSDKKVTRYKIRVTDFINNIINKDSLKGVENIQLGLVVTETINVVTNSTLKNPFKELEQDVKIFPVGSAMHPFGTVLYGGTSDVPEEKRLRLEIFYTKPKQ